MLLEEVWSGRGGAEPSLSRHCSRLRGAEGRGAEPSPKRRSSMRRGAEVEICDGAYADVSMLGGAGAPCGASG